MNVSEPCSLTYVKVVIPLTAIGPVQIGLAGGGAHGKTTFAQALCEAAGADIALALAETSHPIVPLAERFRVHLLQRISTDGLRGESDALRPAYVWLHAVTDGHYELPATAFDPAGLSDEALVLLSTVMAQVREQPHRYADPVTPANKSTDLYRPLLAACSLPISDLARKWLQGHGLCPHGGIWADYAMWRLDHIRGQHPNLPLLMASGLRLPGDEIVIRRRGGYILEVLRPGLAPSGLLTEQRHITPDFILVNDGTLANLQTLARQLWNLITHHQLPSGQAQAIELKASEAMAG